MEEIAFVNPTSLLNQLGLHDRKVSGSSPEAYPTQFPPELERLPKGRMGFGFQPFIGRHSFAGHTTL
jgi:hypothetical protein